jgi:serine/threonine protein kinase HipA of HipAB toxin-antitoxin module
MDQAVGCRWADLLLAEYHAHEVLAENGHGIVGVKCFDLEGRRFLEVPRFDRSSASGRRGVVSLHSLHAAGVGGHARTWADALKELSQEGLVDDGAIKAGARLQSFGELIGNTDMHFGNLALWMSDDLPFRLAPVYDMLPMLWAPSAQGELVNRRHAPEPPIPAMRDAWHEAAEWADQFWMRLASDQRLSKEFICFAEQAIETLARLRGVGNKS